MALVHKFVTQNGAGSGTGDDINNAYTLAQAVSFVNGYNFSTGPDNVIMNLCGDFLTTATLNLNSTSSGPDDNRQLIWWGKDLDGSTDRMALIDAQGGAYPVWTIATDMDWEIFYNVHSANTNLAANNSGWLFPSTVSELRFYKCRASDCYIGFHGQGTTDRLIFVQCTAQDCADDGFMCGTGTWTNAYMCAALDCGGIGFDGIRYHDRCIAGGCGSHGFNNFIAVCHGTAHNCGGSAFRNTLARISLVYYSIATDYTSYALDVTTGHCMAHHLASDEGGLGRLSTALPERIHDTHPLILTANPYVDSDNHDYTLNNVEGGGFDCHNSAGTLMPRGESLSFHALGAAQPCCLPLPEEALGGPWAYEYGIAKLFRLGANRKE